MNRFEELASHFEKVDESKKQIIFSLLKDFVYYEELINYLRDVPQFIINPKNPLQQKKLPVHNIVKDYQAQKNDIATKILRTLDGETVEESALAKALAKFE